MGQAFFYRQYRLSNILGFTCSITEYYIDCQTPLQVVVHYIKLDFEALCDTLRNTAPACASISALVRFFSEVLSRSSVPYCCVQVEVRQCRNH